jgi:hypothetical protein
MKIKEGYLLSEVAGTTVVVPIDPEHTFRNMLKLNGTGKLLWEALAAETTEAALVSRIVEEYEIDEATAAKDVARFLDTLRGYGVLAE